MQLEHLQAHPPVPKNISTLYFLSVTNNAPDTSPSEINFKFNIKRFQFFNNIIVSWPIKNTRCKIIWSSIFDNQLNLLYFFLQNNLNQQYLFYLLEIAILSI
jgi:hypothetical protein